MNIQDDWEDIETLCAEAQEGAIILKLVSDSKLLFGTEETIDEFPAITVDIEGRNPDIEDDFVFTRAVQEVLQEMAPKIAARVAELADQRLLVAGRHLANALEVRNSR